MRTLILISLCLVMVSGALAGDAPSTSTGTKKINMELKDTPIAVAIKGICEGMGANYIMDPQVLSSSIKVTMNLKGVSFDDALNAVLTAGGLIRRKQGEVYYIKPKSIEAEVPIYQEQGIPSGIHTRPDAYSPSLTPLTLVIPEMAIEEALNINGVPSEGYPALILQGELGKKIMPGVRFFQFPRCMAETVLLVTAGLVPPVGDLRIVSETGRSDLNQLLKWPVAPTEKLAAVMQKPFGDFGRYKFPSYFYPSDGLAIAAYLRDGKWLFAIFAKQIEETYLIEKLLSTAGNCYVIKSRPTESDKAVRKLTAQYYDMPLQDALVGLCSVSNLKYKVIASPAGPTYIIEPAERKPTTAPAASTASKPKIIPKSAAAAGATKSRKK